MALLLYYQLTLNFDKLQRHVRTSFKTFKNGLFFRRIYSPAIKNSISLRGQLDDVRTSNFSDIETAIDAPNRKKSTIVRAGGIEPPFRHWQCRVLPLNYARSYIFYTIVLKKTKYAKRGDIKCAGARVCGIILCRALFFKQNTETKKGELQVRAAFLLEKKRAQYKQTTVNG